MGKLRHSRTAYALFILLGSCLLTFNVQAATVNFVLTGVLSMDYGTDTYNLDGADVTWTFSYDTAAAAVGTGTTGGGGAYADYDALSASVSFTNRPNSAADTSLDLDINSFFQTNNYASGPVDSLGTLPGELPNNGTGSSGLAGLLYTDFVFEFADSNYFPGTGAAPLPALVDGDIVSTFAPVIEEPFAYSVAYSTVLTSPVPIPSVAWLFGSGLLALVGMARRKR